MPKKPTSKGNAKLDLSDDERLDSVFPLEESEDTEDTIPLPPAPEPAVTPEEDVKTPPPAPPKQKEHKTPLSLLVLATLSLMTVMGVVVSWIWTEFPKHEDRLRKEQIEVVWAAVPKPGEPETSRAAMPSEEKKREVAKSIKVAAAKAGAPERYNDLERDLGTAPLQLVFSRSNVGYLPVIDHYSERSPWQAYGRAYNQEDNRPRIVLVISELGLAPELAMTVIQDIPPGITLSVLPFAETAQDIINAARAKGHEVLLSLPMEPRGYPRIDPGPSPLLVEQTDRAFRSRLLKMMGSAPGFAGVMPYYGELLLKNQEKVSLLLDILRRRGVLFFETPSEDLTLSGKVAHSVGLAYVKAGLRIDDVPTTSHTIKQLERLEIIAQEKGYVVAITRPFPGVIEAIRRWAPTVKTRGLSLAPVSSLVGQDSKYISPWDKDWKE